jgi:D-sedoheptulose 7-phosphate isomerase
MDQSAGQFIERYLAESEAAMRAFASDRDLHAVVAAFSDLITETMKNGGKLLIAGNGGSAGDAQHMAGEFVSRLFFDHAPLAAVALTTDTSVLTAIGNDYGYDKVFERQVLGFGKPGDVFLGISTSGKSPNILKALSAAKTKGMRTLGFAGSVHGPMDELCEIILHAPTPKTAVIQQIHITAVHLICGLVEKNIFAAAG